MKAIAAKRKNSSAKTTGQRAPSREPRTPLNAPTSNRERRTSNNHLYAVILAGGSGTRFWPLSRHLYPKQLLRIMGGETLIQQTMRRVVECVPADHVYISTNAVQADSIRFQLNEWKEA